MASAAAVAGRRPEVPRPPRHDRASTHRRAGTSAPRRATLRPRRATRVVRSDARVDDDDYGYRDDGWDDARDDGRDARDDAFGRRGYAPTYEDDAYAYDRPPRPRGGGFDDASYYPRDEGRARANGNGPPPDVTLLTQREIQSLLPIGATGEQYAYFWGGAETATQRVGVSLLGLVATVNVTALLAVPAATFFLWAPVALAARRNSAARRSRRLGMWRARVLRATPREMGPSSGYYDAMTRGGGGGGVGGGRGRDGAGATAWALELVVGDASGARVTLRTPLKRSHVGVREGDEVHMVVGSDESYFATFDAVREAYFPRTNEWIGEYPFLDRRAMPAVSARISRDAEDRAAFAERERRERAAGAGGGGYGPGPPP